MNAYELAARAADVIEARGHIRKWYVGGSRGVCLRGAMNVVTTGDPETHPSGSLENIYKELDDLVGARVGYATLPSWVRQTEGITNTEWNAVLWNDYLVRDGAEVIATLRAVAASDPDRAQEQMALLEPIEEEVRELVPA